MYSQGGTLLYREKGETITGNGTNYIYLGKKLIAKYGDVTPQTVNESRQHSRPFGESIEAPKDDVGYTGHKFDTDLGLSYMQARYYDPVIGRFYSNDPVDSMGHMARGNPVHGFNRYTYANNNPYTYVDPDGEFGIQIAAILIGAVIGGATELLTNDNASFSSVARASAVGGAVGLASSLGGVNKDDTHPKV
ncbi:RHS repeat-associated core domain-containing protein [Pseudoalteromonas porphyrae]|uniref:RHS repeat-associated core domain-containing protein n=1 Tax=Pseudoalteromonas porphyrae TaxID=187330 RepID=UPI0006C8A5F5|nr:RHS repeat-associated core domain-containing protein [Pseudoalteromonas porphyrae]